MSRDVPLRLLSRPSTATRSFIGVAPNDGSTPPETSTVVMSVWTGSSSSAVFMSAFCSVGAMAVRPCHRS